MGFRAHRVGSIPGVSPERESVNSARNRLLQKLENPLKLERAAVNPA
jgi:hypothetical protein